jgi:hypothetical protein
MESIQITFGKDKTAIIKGFTIVFMILLHVFGGVGWYEGDIPMNHNEGLIRFMHSFQICVGIFVFMIGYGYAFSKKKDFNYSIKHVKQLLTVFWTILFLFAIPASLSTICSSNNGTRLILLNMLGIDETLLWVSWFVFLYIWAMIVMPFMGRLIDRRPYLWTIIFIGVSLISQFVIWNLVPNFNIRPWWHALFVCFSWTPTILLGYIFARKGWFQKISIPNHWSVPIIATVLVFVVLWLKMVLPGIKILNFDIIYAPIIILCILVVFSQFKMKYFSKVMLELGDKSVYMWFVHALFFTAATRPIYHQFVMISSNLWIVALWTIVLSYLISLVIKKVVEI